MNKVLPEGFRDNLFQKASQQKFIVNKLTDSFELFGYRLIDPPLVEFEETLVREDQTKNDKTFKFMDPKSHKMLAIRSDITVQMMRVASSRLVNEPKPLRLSYAGSVMRVKSDQLNAQRQLFQSGVELIGVNDVAADVEILHVIVKSLESIKISGIYIDLTIPMLVDYLIDSFDIKDDLKHDLKFALNQKDETEIKRITKDDSETFIKLLDPLIDAEKLLTLNLPPNAIKLCERLLELVNLAKIKMPQVKFSIDPVDYSKSNYHQTVGFSVFSENIQEELGYGGRYTINESTPAVGFSLYVDRLLYNQDKVGDKNKILVSPSIAESVLQELRNKGNVTIYSVSTNQEEMKKESILLGCDEILFS